MNMLFRLAVSSIFVVFLTIVRLACAWRSTVSGGTPLLRRRPSHGRGLCVLTLGAFHHRNWYEAHLKPLTQSSVVDRVYVVTGTRNAPLAGVTCCVAPRWIRLLLGAHGSRALWALIAAVRRHPDMIIGYFIFPNALWALFLGRLTGAAVCYQMCGGPREIAHCGSESGNDFLCHVLPGFPGLKPLLDRVVDQFDLIVVRGSNARAYCRAHFPRPAVAIIPGAVPPDRFRPQANGARRYDVMTACRLAPIKRLDVLLKATAEAVRERPGLRVVIVGTGPELGRLQRQAMALGLERNLEFAGLHDDVEVFHRVSRMFVLTSDDEGLSIALAEAMASGLPAVVSQVGDLGELVRDGRNGFLVRPGDAEAFALAIGRLADDEKLRARYSANAARDAHQLCATPIVAQRWTRTLAALWPNLQRPTATGP